MSFKKGDKLTVNQVVKCIMGLVGEDRNKINSMLVGMVDNLQMYIPVHHGADARSLRVYIAKHMPDVYLGPCGDYKQFNTAKAEIKLTESFEGGEYIIRKVSSENAI